jgi:hypothetical protein
MSDTIKLIAGCPNSKPLRVDNFKDLECFFACNFSQKWNKKSHGHVKEIPTLDKD